MITTATPPISGDRGAAPIEAEDPGTGSVVWTSRLIGRLFLARFLIRGNGSILVWRASTTADA